jgi:YD repeat-containing protein
VLYGFTGILARNDEKICRLVSYRIPQYDKLNRRTSRTLPLAQVEAMAYDLVGNLTSKVDLNGKTTSYVGKSNWRLTVAAQANCQIAGRGD